MKSNDTIIESWDGVEVDAGSRIVTREGWGGSTPKLIALAAMAVALTGCGANSLGSLQSNPNCTIKVSLKGSYGSLTPTGTYSGSAVCKPSENAPDPAKVAEPAAPQ